VDVLGEGNPLGIKTDKINILLSFSVRKAEPEVS
jgi:hypothetical protein